MTKGKREKEKYRERERERERNSPGTKDAKGQVQIDGRSVGAYIDAFAMPIGSNWRT
jgi:hypothetical protein